MPRPERRITDAEMGGRMTTYTGRIFDVTDPDPAKVNVVDIAHSLSNSCRFTGHTREFYSTAQHSVMVSELVRPQWRLQALFHDASETYLSDISRPVKYAAGFGEQYRALEAVLMAVIAEAIGFSWPEAPSVKEADRLMLRTEQRDLMPAVRRHEGDALPETIVPWSPQESKERFLARYEELTGTPARR